MSFVSSGSMCICQKTTCELSLKNRRLHRILRHHSLFASLQRERENNGERMHVVQLIVRCVE
jgi:hypothetical protein